jgi:hypothetical protein
VSAGPRDDPRFVRYEHRGASVEVPREWQEESVLFLSAPGERPQPNLSVVRVSCPQAETLETLTAKKMAELAQTLEGIEIEETRETSVGGHRAISVKVGWEELEGRMVQRHVLIRAADSVYHLTGTASAANAERLQAVFDRVVQTLRLSGK